MHLVAEYCMLDTKLVYMALEREGGLRLTHFWSARLIRTMQGKVWSLERHAHIPTLDEALLQSGAGLTFSADLLEAQGLIGFEPHGPSGKSLFFS
jgi:hypothetical protein